MKWTWLYIVILIYGCGGKKADEGRRVTAIDDEIIESDASYRPDSIFSLTFILNDTVYVVGELPLDQKLFLLNNEKGESWPCKAAAHKEYFEEVNWRLTLIAPQPPPGRRFDVAYTGSSLENYGKLGKTPVTNGQKIARYDSLVKHARLIQSLFAQENVFFPDSVIDTQAPSAVRLGVPQRQAILVEYSFYQRFTGPRFLLLDRQIFPLTGPCSYEFVFPYTLNGRYFLQTGSTCCDCGWVIDQIFEITRDSVILVFQDDSYST